MDDPTERPSGPDGTRAESGVTEFWDRVVGRAEDAATAYRDAGWDAVELHPGNATPVPAMGGEGAGDYGLSVLVPPDEFETVERLAGETTFDDADVRRVERGETVFVVAAFLAPESGDAVVVPTHYRRREAASMLDRALSAGEMRVLVRSPDDDPVVFRDDDVASWTPDRESE
ncbi:hypothetical protein SAMN04488063_3626 [Halopelagius inordinatus]|uniref:Uncharacterized protein n=1 Tax=Halopelagius inordinatus TaxID=553467 RepID=A0A1I2WQL4_9EURY|nr:hypothetical protein [Halopelagius inordinatus]SFH02977.1 hypothetical protein SAMN04488063_3626 [Halopelagius inordinatus]